LTVGDVQEDATVDVFSYLGVQVSINCNGVVTFKQQGLIQNILTYCGMGDCNSKWMPAATTPLGMDASTRFNANWDYATAIGMLLYLLLNSHPDIQYAVHQCACFTHAPHLSHQTALLCICHYLKVMEDKGLSFQPTADLMLNCYIDADFAGLYNVEHQSSLCEVMHWICTTARGLSIILVFETPDQNSPVDYRDRIYSPVAGYEGSTAHA